MQNENWICRFDGWICRLSYTSADAPGPRLSGSLMEAVCRLCSTSIWDLVGDPTHDATGHHPNDPPGPPASLRRLWAQWWYLWTPACLVFTQLAGGPQTGTHSVDAPIVQLRLKRVPFLWLHFLWVLFCLLPAWHLIPYRPLGMHVNTNSVLGSPWAHVDWAGQVCIAPPCARLGLWMRRCS